MRNYFIISAVIHFLVLFILLQERKIVIAPRSEPIHVTIVTKIPVMRKQVVEVPVTNKIPTQDSHRVSEHGSTVRKEQVARKSRGRRGRPKSRTKKMESQKGVNTIPATSTIIPTQESGEDVLVLGGLNLQPSQDLLNAIANGNGSGGSGNGGVGDSVDHIPGVVSGGSTLLNSARWKHAGFFNRVKRAISREWRPQPIFRMYGRTWGIKIRVTIVVVTLDLKGKVLQVGVRRSSGVVALDVEAMRAVRAAVAFPNPPKALIRNGRVKFSFGFHLVVHT